MAMNFKTTHANESMHMPETLVKLSQAWASDIDSSSEQLDAEFKKCTQLKDAINKAKSTLSVAHLKEDALCKAAIEELNVVRPNYSVADACISLENTLTEYAKKVAAYASAMVATVRKYSANLYDLFTKKTRVCKMIDLRKFTGMDTSMRMVILTYGDFMEFSKGFRSLFSEWRTKDVDVLLDKLGELRKAVRDDKPTEVIFDQITSGVYNSSVMQALKASALVELVEDTLPTGATGIVSLKESDRFKNLEESRVLSEAGWTSLNKLKDTWTLCPEETAGEINKTYSKVIDFIEETRRFSTDFCVKNPHMCAALTTYASIVARQIDIYTRVYDACWNTLIRLVQACYIEEA